MRSCFVLLGEKIGIIFECLFEYINKFYERASAKCKGCTIVAFVLLIIFIGIDVYEYRLNYKAEIEVENIANIVFVPIVQQIDAMDRQTQEIIEPFKDGLIKIKLQWIKITLLLASAIIGLFINIIKKLVEEIKGIVSDAINGEEDEPMMWIPFWILAVIDISEIILTFF